MAKHEMPPRIAIGNGANHRVLNDFHRRPLIDTKVRQLVMEWLICVV
jgi:hypothetical protein